MLRDAVLHARSANAFYLPVVTKIDFFGRGSRIAARRGLQRSDLLRLVVEEMVAQESQGSGHFDSVKDLIGAATTGKSDLGSDHRRHLKNGFGRAR
jgi:hypothetical protein